MRTHGFAEVLPGLVLGAYPLDCEDVAMLQGLAVQRVLNLTEDSEYGQGQRTEVELGYLQAGIDEYRIRLTDFGGLPVELLEEAVTKVVLWLEAGEIVYLHCRAGRQRSATVAAGVIALSEGLDFHSALALLRQRKPSAQPLEHQQADLERWLLLRDAYSPASRSAGTSWPA